MEDSLSGEALERHVQMLLEQQYEPTAAKMLGDYYAAPGTAR